MDNFIGRACSLFCNCEKTAPILIVSSDLTPEQRGSYARQLVGNPVWLEITHGLQDEAFRLWGNTPLEDSASRERLYAHFRALDLLTRRVNGYIANAALDELKMQKNPQSKKERE